MKYAISNIGWQDERDEEIYLLMQKYGFSGLEIAPTRVFPESPYDKVPEAERWSGTLKKKYGFEVPSMQSIWYGRKEKLFGCEEERKALILYTRKAIDFASAIGCKNLVFGCPVNRSVPEGMSSRQVWEIAISFFRELGEYAHEKGTVIALEANPPVYNTNYINDTQAALQLIKEVGSDGFLLNLDTGTMIQNEESVYELGEQVHLIHHVHISEPGLKHIRMRSLHRELIELLKESGYERYISIEMGKAEDTEAIETAMQYIRSIA